MKLEYWVIFTILGIVSYRVWKWLQKGDVHPDPWGAEIDQAIHSPEAVPVCHHCFAPQEQEDLFCPECGAAIGPYNNYIPWVYVFSEGEVLRMASTTACARAFSWWSDTCCFQ